MTAKNTLEKILVKILRGIKSNPSATSLAKEIGMSRWGIWKILKKLEKESLIKLIKVGSGKTSTAIIKLNWENKILEKIIALELTKESLEQQRWKSNFIELEKYLDFLILYGSILHSPKEANDIDILGVISNKKDFDRIDEILNKIQKTQLKKIHSIIFTPKEFKYELKKPNKAFIDCVKKGIVLYGQEEFFKFIKRLHE